MEPNSKQMPSLYREGREAFLRREHYNTNPHLDDTEEADLWDAGWGDADDENPGIFNHALDAFEIDP